MSGQKSFIFYESWATLLAGLSEEDAGQIIKTVCSKKTGRDYEIKSQTARAVFNMIAPRLDADAESYQEKCEKNRKIAVEREQKKKKRSAQKHERNTNVARTWGDTESDTDTDYDSVHPSDAIKPPTGAKMFPDGNIRADARRIVDAWNNLPEPVPKITKLVAGSPREKQLNARIRQYGTEKVLEAVEKVRRLPFLLGERTDFLVKFDWFIDPKNFAKVLDGNYFEHETARSGTTAPFNGKNYLVQGILEEEAVKHDTG